MFLYNIYKIIRTPIMSYSSKRNQRESFHGFTCNIFSFNITNSKPSNYHYNSPCLFYSCCQGASSPKLKGIIICCCLWVLDFRFQSSRNSLQLSHTSLFLMEIFPSQSNLCIRYTNLESSFLFTTCFRISWPFSHFLIEDRREKL